MSRSASREPCYVGVDVSKARLDAAILPSGGHFAVSNDEEGLDELLGRLEDPRPTLVVLEASGGLERPVAAALTAAGIAVAVLNPRQTRNFARAIGKLAKTDALDARALARFAEAVRPTPRTLPDAEARQFQSILARRRQLIQIITAERTASAPPPPGLSQGASKRTSAGWKRNSPVPTGISTKPSRTTLPSKRTKPS